MRQRKNASRNRIAQIPLDRLVEHPLNANRMSEATLRKLLRNIERTNLYEPIIVRPHPQMAPAIPDGRRGFYQIINGLNRAKALKQLGHKRADCLIWDADDEQTNILLATLNRLTGSDSLEKKTELLRRLNPDKSGFKASELSKLLPFTKGQIEKLLYLKMPAAPAKIEKSFFAKPIVFFVSEEQSNIIEQALSAACKPLDGDNRAVRRTAALVKILNGYIIK